MTENRCNTVLVAYSALPKILKDYDSAFRARLQSSFMSAHLQRGVTTEKLVQEMLDINKRKLAMLQLKEIVERAAGSIPSALSNILVLRFVKGKTFQEIADTENISVRTAFRRFDRARDSFAALLRRRSRPPGARRGDLPQDLSHRPRRRRRLRPHRRRRVLHRKKPAGVSKDRGWGDALNEVCVR